MPDILVLKETISACKESLKLSEQEIRLNTFIKINDMLLSMQQIIQSRLQLISTTGGSVNIRT